MQFLVQQLATQDNQPRGPSYPITVDNDHTDTIHTLQSKVKQLEKDLYYYKKTSRDLRRKIREETASSRSAHTATSWKQSGNVTATSVSVQDTTDRSRPNFVSLQDEETRINASVHKQTGNSAVDDKTSTLAHNYETVGTAVDDNALSKIGIAGTIAGSLTEEVLNMEDSLISGGSAIEVGRRQGEGTEMKSTIVKKHKKQLRQLRFV